MLVVLFRENWSCFLLIGLCLRLVEGKMVHHQPYHSKPPVHGNDIRLITFADGEYKPAVGEILAKDSILYSQKPETRLLRRQLWPIMQETMNTLVDSVAVGANLFKNMLTTNPNPIATKIRNIKNAYISSATSNVSHKKYAKAPTTKNMKKVKKVKHTPDTVRTRTHSEDYIHSYDDGAYTVPKYVIKSASKNPYAQMGLKDYKHFEETVLRELEEKEEKKVEATMSSLFKKNPKNVEEELIQGIPYGGWRPVTGHMNFDESTETNNKAKSVGKLHTNIAHFDVKPFNENVDESRTAPQVHETIIEQPITTKSRRRKPNSSRSTTTSTTASPPRPFTRTSTKEEPNYPEYFLKKRKELSKESQPTKEILQEINYMKRMKHFRENLQGLTRSMNSTSNTNRPSNAMREGMLIDASNEQSVFITPLPKLSGDVIDNKKMRRFNRLKTKTAGQASIGDRGGALGTGAHGSTLKYNSSISAQVTEVSVVNGLGEVQVISDAEDLRSFKIHLGLLGIVVNITLFTVPLYKVQGLNYVTSDDVLTNGVAMDWAKTTDQITFFWFPSFKEVVVVNLTFVPATTSGKAWTNAMIPPTYDSFSSVGTKAKEIAYDLTSSSCAAASSLGNTIAHVFEYYLESALWTVAPGFVPIYTEDGVSVKNPAVGNPHLMFSTICSEDSTGPLGEACFWSHGAVNGNLTLLDNDFSLTFEDLPNFVTTVKDIVQTSPAAFPINGIWIRFSGKSDVYMSTAYQCDTAAIEFPLWKRTDPYNDASGSLAAFQTISQTLTKRFKARSHWGKSGMVYHNRNMLDLKLDPVARQAFVDAMHKFDPNGIFQNNFGRRITKEDSIIDIDPLTTRCALLDNCFCSKNSDCIDTQTCTTLSGYNNYTVCKTKNEVPETQSDKNTFPPMLGVLDWLKNTVPTLASAVLAQCSLQGSLDPLLG